MAHHLVLAGSANTHALAPRREYDISPERELPIHVRLGLESRILLTRGHPPLKDGKVYHIPGTQLKLFIQVGQPPHALGAVANAKDILALVLNHKRSLLRIQDGSPGKSYLLARFRKVDHGGLDLVQEEHGLIATRGTYDAGAMADEQHRGAASEDDLRTPPCPTEHPGARIQSRLFGIEIQGKVSRLPGSAHVNRIGDAHNENLLGARRILGRRPRGQGIHGRHHGPRIALGADMAARKKNEQGDGPKECSSWT